MGTIQFLQTTPEEFKKDLLSDFKKELDQLKTNFQPKEPNEYLSRKEVAKLFKVDLSTIHNWCKAGKLKPLGMGARVYFLRSDIENSLTPLN
jgi:predicted DNA-binding transcriptional regulator AlpA